MTVKVVVLFGRHMSFCSGKLESVEVGIEIYESEDLSQRMVHWETDWKLDGGCHQSVQEFPESL